MVLLVVAHSHAKVNYVSFFPSSVKCGVIKKMRGGQEMGEGGGVDPSRPMPDSRINDRPSIKVREGRRTAKCPKLCGFLDYTAIFEHIQTCYTSN